jgi:hypothetical protein
MRLRRGANSSYLPRRASPSCRRPYSRPVHRSATLWVVAGSLLLLALVVVVAAGGEREGTDREVSHPKTSERPRSVGLVGGPMTQDRRLALKIVRVAATYLEALRAGNAATMCALTSARAKEAIRENYKLAARDGDARPGSPRCIPHAHETAGGLRGSYRVPRHLEVVHVCVKLAFHEARVDIRSPGSRATWNVHLADDVAGWRVNGWRRTAGNKTTAGGPLTILPNHCA